MKICKMRVVWGVVCLIASFWAGVYAYQEPVAFAVLNNAATPLLYLVFGFSLAIYMVLSYSIPEDGGTPEQARMAAIIRRDNDVLRGGQVILLVLCTAAIWGRIAFEVSYGLKYLAAQPIFAAIACALQTLVILWGGTLPSLLRQVLAQNALLRQILAQNAG